VFLTLQHGRWLSSSSSKGPEEPKQAPSQLDSESKKASTGSAADSSGVQSGDESDATAEQSQQQLSDKQQRAKQSNWTVANAITMSRIW
jgi:hypothetical protein